MAAKKKAHPGFKAVAAGIAKKQGISKERASAIVAAGARKASPAAKKANPNLKKVVEKKTGESYASKAAMKKHEKGESKAVQRKEVKGKK